MQLTPAGQDRIAAAVAAAETRTAGEIYCVVAPRASAYREVPIVWAALLALALPPLALLAGFRPRALDTLLGGWTVGHELSVSHTVLASLAAYIALQLAVFLLVLLAMMIPAVRRFATPGALKTDRVRRAALDQFLSHGLHQTQDRTGVLIFASLEERRAEVIADETIYLAAPPAVWEEVVALLVAGIRSGDLAGGFVKAIEKSGDILAAHVPPRADNPNELSDRIVVLDERR